MDISVVIPVYKVEKYLKKCVDSILHQTISNYEVILVDDGSPDGCPAICDAYAAEYPNVIALHKTNGGLSDARNYGVRHASADYVVFVDSDDYVDPEYLESLWKLHTKYDADIVVQGVTSEEEDGVLLNVVKGHSERVVKTSKAIELMCNGREIGIFAVAKLYQKSYLQECSFPYGKFHEDIFTTYRLFAMASTIAVGVESNYHYVIRKQSIHTANFSLQHMDSLDAVKKMIAFVEDKYPEAIVATYIRLAIESNSLLHRALNCAYYPEVRKKIMEQLKGRWIHILMAKDLSITVKLQLILCKTSATLYRWLYTRLKNRKER